MNNDDDKNDHHHTPAQSGEVGMQAGEAAAQAQRVPDDATTTTPSTES